MDVILCSGLNHMFSFFSHVSASYSRFGLICIIRTHVNVLEVISCHNLGASPPKMSFCLLVELSGKFFSLVNQICHQRL